MPHMLLILQKPGDAPPADEGQRRYQRMLEFGMDLKARGVLVAGESLGTDANGVRVVMNGSKRRVVDGPFAEAKEIVGGFFLLDCDRAQAVAAAGECPAAEWATIEVREVGRCWD